MGFLAFIVIKIITIIIIIIIMQRAAWNDIIYYSLIVEFVNKNIFMLKQWPSAMHDKNKVAIYAT